MRSRSRGGACSTDGIAADETWRVEEVDALLDRNVVVKDPAIAEARWEEMLSRRPPGAGPVSLIEIEEICRDDVERRRADDLPEVEDFPLHPEEETPTFTNLKAMLDLRFLRAMHHWRGRTEVCLTDLVVEMVGRCSDRTDPAAPSSPR